MAVRRVVTAPWADAFTATEFCSGEGNETWRKGIGESLYHSLLYSPFLFHPLYLSLRRSVPIREENGAIITFCDGASHWDEIFAVNGNRWCMPQKIPLHEWKAVRRECVLNRRAGSDGATSWNYEAIQQRDRCYYAVEKIDRCYLLGSMIKGCHITSYMSRLHEYGIMLRYECRKFPWKYVISFLL